MDPSVRLEHALLAVDAPHEVNVMLELAAPEPAGETARAPLHVALVLDRSGSMHGAKLETAKRCAAWLAGRLHADDELALVDFDSHVRVLAPLAPVGSSAVASAIGRIQPGGQTNLSGGWLKGLEELRRASGTPRKLLLLTDGLANEGITEPEALVALARGAYESGVGTSTIGFGEGFDEDTLTALADAGGGRAHYAETPDAAPAIFVEELEGLTRLVAQNVSVEIRPTADVELVGVLNDYPSTAVPGGVHVMLGDAYAGERRRVVLSLQLPDVAALGVAKVADLVLRYVSVGDEIAEHTVTLPVAVNLVSAHEAAASQPDLEVREEVLVLRAARARNEAVRLADAGDLAGAEKLLSASAHSLRDASAAMPAHADLLSAEAGALDELAPGLARYDAIARKRLIYEANRRQRRTR